MTENEISKIIVDAAVEVHREMGGPGLLEDVYEEALAEELRLRDLRVERQLPLRILYKGKVLQKPLRLDLKVENLVLVDNKATTEWHPVFEAQMLTYLRLTKLKLGLVINFGERFVKDGIHRVVNGLLEKIDFNAKAQRSEGARPLRSKSTSVSIGSIGANHT
jgi:GxxExxY protein